MIPLTPELIFKNEILTKILGILKLKPIECLVSSKGKFLKFELIDVWNGEANVLKRDLVTQICIKFVCYRN